MKNSRLYSKREVIKKWTKKEDRKKSIKLWENIGSGGQKLNNEKMLEESTEKTRAKTEKMGTEKEKIL